MFHRDIQKRIDLLNGGLIEISQVQVHLDEKNEEGFADLQLKLNNPCILFRDLENKKLQYFKNKMCSDYVMFEYVKKDNDWRVHIFELKRSVGGKEWKRIKKQFMGALQNALALAGVLDICVNLEKVSVYTVFRNDKLNQSMNPARLKRRMYERETDGRDKECMDWNDEKLILDFLGDKEFRHKKIKLDIESGKGIFCL